MPLLTREDELHGYAPDAFAFWRNLAVYFCVFSVVGHWMEIAYCLFMDVCFGIVDDDSLVWDDPLYPFLAYGVGVVVCVAPCCQAAHAGGRGRAVLPDRRCGVLGHGVGHGLHAEPPGRFGRVPAVG